MKTLAILSGQQGCRAPDSHTLGHPGQRPQKQQLEQPSASPEHPAPYPGPLVLQTGTGTKQSLNSNQHSEARHCDASLLTQPLRD